MKKYRQILIALALLIAFGWAFAQQSASATVNVDLKDKETGMCYQDQIIPDIPAGCSLVINGAICIINLEDWCFEIHQANSDCNNPYERVI